MRHAVVQKARLERMIASEGVMVQKPGQSWKMKLEFTTCRGSGQDVLRISELRAGDGDRGPLEDVNLHLGYGERGCSSARTAPGKPPCCAASPASSSPGPARCAWAAGCGWATWRRSRRIWTATPLALIRVAAPLDETEARSYPHYYLFAGDEVFVPVARPSWGERSRLALALLAVQGCNFLLLDEPINHLDIPSRESFERGDGALRRHRAGGRPRSSLHRTAGDHHWALEDRHVRGVREEG